jgi:hypothetical protein
MHSDLDSVKNSDCRPDASSYTIVMNALRSAKNVDRWKESMELLEKMLRQCKLGYIDCRPNAVTFTLLLHSLAELYGTPGQAHRSRATVEAESAFQCRYHARLCESM